MSLYSFAKRQKERYIYCCQCEKDSLCKKVFGSKIYPRLPKLNRKIFWQCPNCFGYVGTHSRSGGNPLGTIPTPRLRKARIYLHNEMDGLWRGKPDARKKRSNLYGMISIVLGYQYHNGEISSIQQAAEALQAVRTVKTFVEERWCFSQKQFKQYLTTKS